MAIISKTVGCFTAATFHDPLFWGPSIFKFSLSLQGKMRLKHPKAWMYNYHQTFPHPYNAFIEEYFLTEEIVNWEV